MSKKYVLIGVFDGREEYIYLNRAFTGKKDIYGHSENLDTHNTSEKEYVKDTYKDAFAEAKSASFFLEREVVVKEIEVS